MEIVDELMTPGCPNCFVKHMSAALARMAAFRIPKVEIDSRFEEDITLARALVNLVEAYTGYTSHFDYAVGLMVVAEESAVVNDMVGTVEASRAIRTKLVADGEKGIPSAVLELGKIIEPGDLVSAHILEAFRELPSMDHNERNFTADDIRGMIEEAKNEYFDISKGDTEEGKEVK